jgi:hypothetical protein
LYLALGLTFIYGFALNIDILDRKYDADGREAVSAKVGVFLRPGFVVADVMKRDEVYNAYRHWLKRSRSGR